MVRFLLPLVYAAAAGRVPGHPHLPSRAVNLRDEDGRVERTAPARLAPARGRVRSEKRNTLAKLKLKESKRKRHGRRHPAAPLRAALLEQRETPAVRAGVGTLLTGTGTQEAGPWTVSSAQGSPADPVHVIVEVRTSSGRASAVEPGNDKLQEDRNVLAFTAVDTQSEEKALATFTGFNTTSGQRTDELRKLFAADKAQIAAEGDLLQDEDKRVRKDADLLKETMPQFEKVVRKILACEIEVAAKQQKFNAAIAETEALIAKPPDDAAVDLAVQAKSADRDSLDDLLEQRCTRRLVQSLIQVKAELSGATDALINSFQTLMSEKIQDPTRTLEAVREAGRAE